MHLHGTFYTVESRGTFAEPTRSTTTTAGASSRPRRWTPARRCRCVGCRTVWGTGCSTVTFRATSAASMREGDLTAGDDMMSMHAMHDIQHSMAGLVIGITVQPGDETAAPDLAPNASRNLTVAIDALPNRYGAGPGFGFAIADPERSTGASTDPERRPSTTAEPQPDASAAEGRAGRDHAREQDEHATRRFTGTASSSRAGTTASPAGAAISARRRS